MDIVKAKNKLLSEISVNKPGTSFTVTPKGIEWVDDFVKLEKLSQKFGCGELLKDEGPEDIRYELTQLLYIFSDTYGEGIINMKKPNNMDDYVKKLQHIWDEGDNGHQHLLNFIKIGFISPINFQ